MLLVAPLVSSSTSVLFDALTAMCIAYGWNIIGGFTGYASFGNVAYLGLGAFVAAGFMSRQPGHPAWPWFVGDSRSRSSSSRWWPALIGLVGPAAARPLLLDRHARRRRRDAADHPLAEALFGPHGLFPNFFGGGLPLNFPLARGRHHRRARRSTADRYFFYDLGLLTALSAGR